MPLEKKILQDELSKFIDSESPLFIEFPKTTLEASKKWSNALKIYSSTVFPTSSTINNTQSLELQLNSISTGNFNIVFPLALSSYVNIIALGMTSSGFTAVPPPLPTITLQISSIIPSLGMSGVKSSIIIDQFSTIIDSWYKTGTATLISPPNTLVKWL